MPGFTETSVFPKLWEASGLALSAARLVGTNSMPRPSPTGMSGKTVTTPSRGTPGMPSTARPMPAPTNPITAGSRSPWRSASLPAMGAAAPTSSATSTRAPDAPSAEKPATRCRYCSAM